MKVMIKQSLGLDKSLKDTIIQFKFDYNNFNLVVPLEYHIPNYNPPHSPSEYCSDKSLLEKYHNWNFHGRVNFSRIDGIEIISVDLGQVLRDHRIDDILNSK